jgi:hypothetical protein
MLLILILGFKVGYAGSSLYTENEGNLKISYETTQHHITEDENVHNKR